MFPPVIDLNNYRRQREAQGRAIPVKVIRHVDPQNANRSIYFIIAPEQSAVQSTIASLMAEVESFGNGGDGEFTHPRRQNGLWFSEGYVDVRPDVIQEYWK